MKKYSELLGLARESIAIAFEAKELKINEAVKKKYSKKQACFVTLTIKGDLRGCIGSLEARQELWKDVAENARNAAFNDSRFMPLTKEELAKIKIEISILAVPKRISYKDAEDLKKKIKGKGVVLGKGFNSATYLPQVWQEINDSEEFLSSLCRKSGLPSDAWKKEKLKVLVYSVDKIEE